MEQAGPEPSQPVARTVSHDEVQRFVQEVFVRLGVTEEAARHVAACLVTAELRGIASHGLTRVPVYARRVRMGLVNPRAVPRVERTGVGTARVDGDNGMGALVGSIAIQEAMALADDAGVGAVAVFRSNHFGVAAYYVAQAVERGYIALMASNAPPTMAPWGGRAALLGTNPIAIGVPAGRHPPILLDMATSVVARGRVILAAQRGERIPEGWALDREGRPTTDARAALEGCVLPFGGPKGSALALVIDVLCGVLAGAGFGSRVRSMYDVWDAPQDVGHFALVVDVGRYMPREVFLRRVDELIDEVKACPPALGHDEVLLPGEKEHRLAQRRLSEGIPLPLDVLGQLREVAEEVLGADLPSWLASERGGGE